jgi:hypothetical protein
MKGLQIASSFVANTSYPYHAPTSHRDRAQSWRLVNLLTGRISTRCSAITRENRRCRSAGSAQNVALSIHGTLINSRCSITCGVSSVSDLSSRLRRRPLFRGRHLAQTLPLTRNSISTVQSYKLALCSPPNYSRLLIGNQKGRLLFGEGS